jgi:hypothetical protein
MRDPALTVQLVVRDVEQWLPDALNSLRAQTRKDFEVIAVDDGSTDGTTTILRAATDLPITYIRTTGLGEAGARNAAVAAAHAPVVATLDGDDAWLPWYVERVLDRLDRNPEIDIVCPEALLALDGELTTDRYYDDGRPGRFFDDDQLEHILRVNFIIAMSAARREVFEKVGEYIWVGPASTDWDFWIRALEAGFRAVHDPYPCSIYRVRLGSLSGSRVNTFAGHVDVLERAAARLPAPLAEIAEQQLRLERRNLAVAQGKDALLRGDAPAARRSFAEVVRAAGASPKERLASALVIASPRLGQRMLERRAATPPPATAAEARRFRE